MSDIQLTPEEEAQFTVYNAAANDLARVGARKRDTVLPCWLCMSEEARQEFREDLLKHLKEQGFIPSYEDLEGAEKMINGRVPESVTFPWRAAELERKQGRAEHDPHSFFMQNGPPGASAP